MFALIGCKACKYTGEFTRKRGDKVACTSCNGTGVVQMVEVPETHSESVKHGQTITLNFGKKRILAKVYDPIADILASA